MWFTIVGEIRDIEPTALAAQCACGFGSASCTAAFGGESSRG
jgi:hypothetical protein